MTTQEAKKLKADGKAAIFIALVLALVGCAGPPKSGAIAIAPVEQASAKPSPVVIQLEHFIIVAQEEQTIEAEWSRVMTAINATSQIMELQPTGKTDWKDGRAFPLFVSDQRETVLLIQCMRRTATQTWVKVTFFEAPVGNEKGGPIKRDSLHHRALAEKFWVLLTYHLT